MKTLILPIDLGQAIVNYLELQPYREVAALLQALTQLQPAPEPGPEVPVAD